MLKQTDGALKKISTVFGISVVCFVLIVGLSVRELSAVSESAKLTTWSQLSGWTTTLQDSDPIGPEGWNFDTQPVSIVMNENDDSFFLWSIKTDIAPYAESLYFAYEDNKKGVIYGWDLDSKSWTNDFDKMTAVPFLNDSYYSRFYNHAMAIDSKGTVYMLIADERDWDSFLYLCRYTGKNGFEMWYPEKRIWTADMQKTMFIHSSYSPPYSYPFIEATFNNISMAVDSNDQVYFTYDIYRGDVQQHGVYLGRYSDDGGPYVWGIKGWTNDQSEYLSLDAGPPARWPKIAIDTLNRVYIVFKSGICQTGSTMMAYYEEGKDVQMWDNDNYEWTKDFLHADPIHTELSHRDEFDLAVSQDNSVYVAVSRILSNKTTPMHIILVRYNDKEKMKVWAHEWVKCTKDPIRIDSEQNQSDSEFPSIVINGKYAYVTYQKLGLSGSKFEDIFRIYVNRFMDKDVRIWDVDSWSWTTDFDSGDPIDTNDYGSGILPRMVTHPGIDNIYIVYQKEALDRDMQRLFMSRISDFGADVMIWVHSQPGWSKKYWEGEPIDAYNYKADAHNLAVSKNYKALIPFISGESDHLGLHVDQYLQINE